MTRRAHWTAFFLGLALFLGGPAMPVHAQAKTKSDPDRSVPVADSKQSDSDKATDDAKDERLC